MQKPKITRKGAASGGRGVECVYLRHSPVANFLIFYSLVEHSIRTPKRFFICVFSAIFPSVISGFWGFVPTSQAGYAPGPRWGLQSPDCLFCSITTEYPGYAGDDKWLFTDEQRRRAQSKWSVVLRSRRPRGGDVDGRPTAMTSTTRRSLSSSVTVT